MCKLMIQQIKEVSSGFTCRPNGLLVFFAENLGGGVKNTPLGDGGTRVPGNGPLLPPLEEICWLKKRGRASGRVFIEVISKRMIVRHSLGGAPAFAGVRIPSALR